MTHGTCQVCGRRIKIKKGGESLAAHGYQQRGPGNQNECYGSYQLPYEVTNEGLLYAIERHEQQIARDKKWVADHVGTQYEARITANYNRTIGTYEREIARLRARYDAWKPVVEEVAS